MPKPRPDHPHGTRGRYQLERCRCTECRQANAEYQAQRKGRPRPVREQLPKGAKRCRICKLVKMLYAFRSWQAKGREVRDNRCAECFAVYLREWQRQRYRADPEYRRCEYRERYRTDPVFRAREIERARARRKRMQRDARLSEEVAA